MNLQIKLVAVLVGAVVLLEGCTAIGVRPPSATEAAVADTATTAIALAHGATELNPLGFAGTVVSKMAVFAVTESGAVPEKQAKDIKRYASAVWTGAAVNNLIQILFVTSPIGLSIGLGVASAIFILN